MQEIERDFYKSRDHNISKNEASRCIRLKTIGKVYYFTFKQYGGIDAALYAARKFRDNLPVSSFRGIYDHNKRNAVGASCILGVAMRVLRGEHVGWVAVWQAGPPGNRKSKSKTFTFANYGTNALEKAKQCREKKVKENAMIK